MRLRFYRSIQISPIHPIQAHQLSSQLFRSRLKNKCLEGNGDVGHTRTLLFYQLSFTEKCCLDNSYLNRLGAHPFPYHWYKPSTPHGGCLRALFLLRHVSATIFSPFVRPHVESCRVIAFLCENHRSLRVFSWTLCVSARWVVAWIESGLG